MRVAGAEGQKGGREERQKGGRAKGQKGRTEEAAEIARAQHLLRARCVLSRRVAKAMAGSALRFEVRNIYPLAP